MEVNKAHQASEIPQKSLLFILILSLVVIALGAILLGLITFLTPPQQNPGKGLPITSQGEAEEQEEFLLLLGGELVRSDGTYQLTPTLSAQLLDAQRELYADQLATLPQVTSLYRVELVGSTGERKLVNSSVTYCPPQTDVCDVLTDTEPPATSRSHWTPMSVKVEPGFERIEFSVSGNVVKTISKASSPPAIVTLTKTVRGEGTTTLSWNVTKGDADYVGLLLEYTSAPDTWQTAGFGNLETFTYFNVDSGSVQSTLEELSFRLIATDGFHAVAYLAEDFIPTPLVKELDLLLYGAPTTERIVGQDMFLKLAFVDPQTGYGCDGLGCRDGENKGKYEVTWTSDQQTICPSDVYDGVLQYRFKKTGKHTLTVKVHHTEKDYPQGEMTVQVNVSPSPYELESRENLECSF